MNTINRRRTQLSVVAVAALAIFAVAAVILLTGGAPAQATTASLTPDDGAAQPRPQQTDPSPTPRHAPPEPCPGETGNPNNEAARVVSSGHIALFDVYWNPVERELTNTSCPPTVEYVPAKPKKGKTAATPERDDRSPSNIDIAKTIIHIPNSDRIDLNAADTPYPRVKYEELWDADGKENRDSDGDGTPEEGVGDGIVWALPACPPAGSPAADDLCIMFSAALLNSEDWATSLKEPNGKVEFLLDHVHQIDTDVQDPRYTLAYDVPAADAAGPFTALWDSSNVKVSRMPVAPEGYERPMLFFTDRGTYLFRVEIQGYPDRRKDRADGLKPISLDRSVSSDERDYIIHVGAASDLSVTATATPSSPSHGDTVSVTIAASNVGSEAVPATNVDVTLPPGLTYASHAPAGDTFADGDGDGVRTWAAGSLASGASKSLTVKATVDAGTHGRDLAVTAAISGTETLTITETDAQGNNSEEEEYTVPVVDTDSSNDTAAVTVTVPASSNTPPIFTVTHSIAENSAAGTSVGDPVGVKDPDSDDTLTFTLTGNRSHKFTASSVSGGAQIAVARGAILDYETVPMYDLVLGVSDGKDDDGNPDDTVDHTIGVVINLEDVADDPSLAISANHQYVAKGVDVTLTATPSNLPAGHGALTYRWIETDPSDASRTSTPPGVQGPTWTLTKRFGDLVTPITYRYQVEVSWTIDGVETRIRSSNEVTVTWQ